jgi:elongation factor P
MPSVIATDLKTGVIFKENGAPYLVLRYEHVKSARGGASVKVKARNLLTDQVIEKGYTASNKVEEADITRGNAQYLYKENGFVFMNPTTYEQFTIPEDVVGDGAKFIREGETVQLMYYEGRAVSVQLPVSMVFEVTYTEPGYKGNTVSNVYKDAELDNGAKVKVPTFVKIGDKIKIDTRTGEYVSKA